MSVPQLTFGSLVIIIENMSGPGDRAILEVSKSS